jgi:hypothetical protein
MVISFTLSIPHSGEVKIHKKIGDSFFANEPLVEFSSFQDKIEIDISQKLHVSPKVAASFLLKNLGDDIGKDEVIARYKTGFLFKKTIEVKSMFRGKIYELDNFTGKIKIAGIQKKQILSVPFSGKVVDVKEQSLLLEFEGVEIVPVKIFGETFFAEIRKIAKFNEEVDANLINVDDEGKILIGGHFSLTDLNKAMACGVHGVVAGKISDSNLQTFDNSRKYSFLDEDSQIMFSVAIVSEDELNKLEHLKNGQGLYFDGTQGKIIIPHN